MSDNVIDINANKPHWTERVTCSACGHWWQAVAPVGTDVCECPKCHQMSGVRGRETRRHAVRIQLGYHCGDVDQHV